MNGLSNREAQVLPSRIRFRARASTGAGGLPTAKTGELSQLLCEWVESELGVAPQRIYINFADVPASLRGWNGETS